MRAHRPPPPRRERSRGRYVGHPKPRGSSHRVSPGPPCERQTRACRSFEPHLQRASTVHRTGGSPVSQITSHCNPVGYTSCWMRLVAPNCWEGEGSRPEILDHLGRHFPDGRGPSPSPGLGRALVASKARIFCLRGGGERASTPATGVRVVSGSDLLV